MAALSLAVPSVPVPIRFRRLSLTARVRPAPEPTPDTFQWTRSETIALASNTCTQCHGLGLHTGRAGNFSPCNCVLRSIFRACFGRYRYISQFQDRVSGSWPQIVRHGKDSRLAWGRKNEEFLADFYLTAKRTLTAYEFKVFSLHFLFGADWKVCCRKLLLERGNFFHCIYRVEQKLGRAFREMKPYALFPLDEYFHSNIRN